MPLEIRRDLDRMNLRVPLIRFELAVRALEWNVTRP